MELYSKMLAMQNRRQKERNIINMKVIIATMKIMLKMTFMEKEKKNAASEKIT